VILRSNPATPLLVCSNQSTMFIAPPALMA